MRACPNCGHLNRDDATFCIKCGKEMHKDVVCPYCGALAPTGTRFCDRCGSKFPTIEIQPSPTVKPVEELKAKITALGEELLAEARTKIVATAERRVAETQAKIDREIQEHLQQVSGRLLAEADKKMGQTASSMVEKLLADVDGKINASLSSLAESFRTRGEAILQEKLSSLSRTLDAASEDFRRKVEAEFGILSTAPRKPAVPELKTEAPEVPGAKSCQSCGAPLREDSKFCLKCGARVAPLAAPSPARPSLRGMASRLGKMASDFRHRPTDLEKQILAAVRSGVTNSEDLAGRFNMTEATILETTSTMAERGYLEVERTSLGQHVLRLAPKGYDVIADIPEGPRRPAVPATEIAPPPERLVEAPPKTLEEPKPEAPRPQAPPPAGQKYCQNCATLVDNGTVYCPTCGSMEFSYRAPVRIGRPTGATIVGILQIVVGIITALIFLTLGSLAASVLVWFGLGGLAAMTFALAVVFGLLPLVFGIAIFTGREWARILLLIAGVLDVLSVVFFNIPGFLLGLLILWYFTRPRVVAYFKQAK